MLKYVTPARCKPYLASPIETDLGARNVGVCDPLVMQVVQGFQYMQ